MDIRTPMVGKNDLHGVDEFAREGIEKFRDDAPATFSWIVHFPRDQPRVVPTRLGLAKRDPGARKSIENVLN